MDINIKECMEDIFEKSTAIRYGQPADPAVRPKSFKVTKNEKVEKKKGGCGC